MNLQICKMKTLKHSAFRQGHQSPLPPAADQPGISGLRHFILPLTGCAALSDFKCVCIIPCPTENRAWNAGLPTIYGIWRSADGAPQAWACVHGEDAANRVGQGRMAQDTEHPRRASTFGPPDPGVPPASHPYPEARRSLTGFQAQMNTSDSWPRRTVALLGGISTSPSISIGFE